VPLVIHLDMWLTIILVADKVLWLVIESTLSLGGFYILPYYVIWRLNNNIINMSGIPALEEVDAACLLPTASVNHSLRQAVESMIGKTAMSYRERILKSSLHSVKSSKSSVKNPLSNTIFEYRPLPIGTAQLCVSCIRLLIGGFPINCECETRYNPNFVFFTRNASLIA